ncbi:glutamyl-tRNA reductase [Algiphilus sp.]|uniref:glutamyl-tRNA reductase n=1 Tax=Algiphilus sp. TaxID=1872431 RepID=UPI001CA6D65D|nr:glutamyl-tRNA reductase [Algiphilus sp.]MBY8966075.1 glutamyl-tRNA reductase [Algiphilus acroporae]MCI5104873.1 glutamyl-tRNA reductase [Algiphilus sp.]MCR9092057.1 glutamyl-tRNA reductase [Pseudomonadota bacterium]
MALIALGLSHHNAPVEVRSQLAFTDTEAGDALARLRARGGIEEAALLSTCNRTEVLGVLEPAAEHRIAEWWAAERGAHPEQLRGYLRVHRDLGAVRHSLRVASGLDSLVIGEPQILGQMKQAYALAEASRTAGPILQRLFQHAFAVAKLVRSQTEIGAHPVSVAYAAVQMAKRIFTDLRDQTAVLIGAGETIQLIARHLRSQGVTRIIVANRTIAKAEHLAREVHGYAIALADLPERLSDADLLVASTSSREPVVGVDAIRHALTRRRHKPMCMIDLAVPRDIDTRATALDDVFLYTVDDLRQIIAQNMGLRQQAAEQAEALVADRAEAFNQWLESREVAGTIRGLRGRATEQRDAVLAKARRRLAAGEDPDAVLEHALRALANRLAHAPSRTLRHADPVEQALLKSAARKLFDLPED